MPYNATINEQSRRNAMRRGLKIALGLIVVTVIILIVAMAGGLRSESIAMYRALVTPVSLIGLGASVYLIAAVLREM